MWRNIHIRLKTAKSDWLFHAVGNPVTTRLAAGFTCLAALGVHAHQNSEMRWEFFLSRSTPGSLPDGLFRFRSSALSVFGPCTCGNGGCVCRHHGSLGSCLLLSLDLCTSPWLFQSVRACKVGIQVCWMFSSCLLDHLAKSLQTSFFLLFPWDLVSPQSVGHSVLQTRMIVLLCWPIFGRHWNVFRTVSWSPIGCFRCVFCRTTDTLPCVLLCSIDIFLDSGTVSIADSCTSSGNCMVNLRSRVKLVFRLVSASDQLGMSREGLTSGCATFVLATKIIHVSSSGLGLSLAVVSSSVLSTRCEKILFFDLCIFFFFRSFLSFFSRCFLRHVLFVLVLDMFLAPVFKGKIYKPGEPKMHIQRKFRIPLNNGEHQTSSRPEESVYVSTLCCRFSCIFESSLIMVEDELENLNQKDGVFNKEEGAKFRPVRRKHCSKNNGSLLLIMSLLVVVLVVTVVRVHQPLQQRQQGSLGSENDPTLSNKKDNDTLRKEPNSNNSSKTQKESTTGLHLCDPSIQCETDRWGHNQRLELGHSICNAEWRFGVGIMIDEDGSSKGALLWQDCNRDVLLVLQEVNVTKHDLEFQMTEQGVFQLLDGDSTVLWQLEPNVSPAITPTARCLSNNPTMDCPYLHLRKRGGNIVLNWISNRWNARKVHRVYPGLFPADYN